MLATNLNTDLFQSHDGQFEFLPITLESAGVIFKAVLRLGARAGFEVSSPALEFASFDILKASAGVQIGVYANIAEFVTNVTASQTGDENDDCHLRVEESYQLALGAHAGASVALAGHTWGPVPETEIPIFYTTMDACAIRKSSVTTRAVGSATTKAMEVRQDDEGLSTATKKTKVVYEGVACLSDGMANCPASLQTTSKYTTTETLTTVVPSGASVVWAESVISTIASTVPFGTAVQKLAATSGTPVSYIPPTPTSTSRNEEDDKATTTGILEGKTGGLSNKLIIGLSVGLGVPVLIAILGSIVYVFPYVQLYSMGLWTNVRSIDSVSRKEDMSLSELARL